VVVAATAFAILAHGSLTSASSSPPAPPVATSPIRIPHGERPGAPAQAEGVVPAGADDRALGEAGGAVPGGTTIFDDEVPGVSRLNPALLRALRRAATDAGWEGVDFIVNSGWRSAAYEDQLRREAVAKYGSESEAARWVATGSTSPHVSGDAVDLGSAGAGWLSQHGAGYGLCQIYANEPWHFELRPQARTRGCPPMYADPTQDPRMQR
jgi:D-alanyl-D-alanine carboxypeptidase